MRLILLLARSRLSMTYLLIFPRFGSATSELTLPLGLSSWDYIRESVRRAPNLDGANFNSSDKLKVYRAPPLSNLLKEKTLFVRIGVQDGSTDFKAKL